MFRVLVSKGGELHSKGIIVVVELETGTTEHGGIGNLIAARTGITTDGSAIDSERSKLDTSRPIALSNVLRTEPGNATRTTKKH